MGDKSPKSKAREKKQRQTVKADQAAKARAKQDPNATTTTSGKK